MTNQKSLSISHVNVGYTTGGKFSLISLLMELTLTIFPQLCQPDVCVCMCVSKREREEKLEGGRRRMHCRVCASFYTVLLPPSTMLVWGYLHPLCSLKTTICVLNVWWSPDDVQAHVNILFAAGTLLIGTRTLRLHVNTRSRLLNIISRYRTLCHWWEMKKDLQADYQTPGYCFDWHN